MTLNITVEFESGIEMEENLNKAIRELSSILEKRGLSEMELLGHDFDKDNKFMYEVKITKP